MKPRTLAAFVDIQNLFHGLCRMTGDRQARVDYIRLRNMIRGEALDVEITAYVMTPVKELPVEDPSSDSVPPEDRVGFVDDRFVDLLKRLGYRVRRDFCAMQVTETDDERYVSYVRTSMARSVYRDVREVLDSCDIILLVSGVGALLPTAEMVKAAKKELWIAAFVRAGDMHSEYKRIADRIIPLDTSLRWTGYVKRLKR
jgi:hypothetical protein